MLGELVGLDFPTLDKVWLGTVVTTMAFKQIQTSQKAKAAGWIFQTEPPASLRALWRLTLWRLS